MAKPKLTPRQQQARRIYMRSFWPCSILLYILVMIALTGAFLLVIKPAFAFLEQFPAFLYISETLLSILVYLVVGIANGFMFLLVHRRALNAVRCAGLLDEETVVITRTATNFEGEVLKPFLPRLSLNKRGVFAFHFGLLPRQVAWHKIESAHFYRLINFENGSASLTVTLKGASDKTLLVLNPNTFAGATPEFQQSFVAELKRRLTAGNSE